MRELKNILCIDDEQDILQIVGLCLETMGGYQIQTCSNGQDGIAKALEWKPDMIMIDVMMPDMDGPSTFKRMREHEALSDTPVVFMTARVQRNEINEYIDIGAAAVIAKPFDPMTLSTEIQGIWSRLHG